MTQKYYSLMTNSGIEYINSQVLINPNKIMADGWYIKLGNGETEPSADMTDLSNVIYTKTAEDYPQITFGSNNDGHYAEMLLPESLSGEIITEAGLYNQNDVLIAVAKTYIDLSQSGDGLEMSVKQRIYLSAVPASVSVIYTAQADLITEDRLAEELSELSDTINNNINNVSNIKQDKLTAGANISIDSNNKISASGKYPYSFNSGNIDSNGNADLISYNGSDVTYKVGNTYPNLTGTKADGQQFEVDAIADDDISALADGSYKKYVGADGTAELLNNTLSISKTEPSSPKDNDVWINNTVSPLTIKKYVAPNYDIDNPTISADGILSNISSSSCIKIPSRYTGYDRSNGYKFVCTCKTPTDTTGYQALAEINGLICIVNGKFQLRDDLNNKYITDITFDTDTWYDIEAGYNAETKKDYFKHKKSSDENWTTEESPVITSFVSATNPLKGIGINGTNYPFLGEIDLKTYKIYVADELVYQPNIDSQGWQNYDKIPLGKITVSSGAVTGAETYLYNKDYIGNNIIKSYRNGNKGYIIHADGYCEQWGRFNGAETDPTRQIDLHLPYANTDYNIQLTARRSDDTNTITAYLVGDRTNSSFTWAATTTYTAGIDWKTTGYIPYA